MKIYNSFESLSDLIIAEPKTKEDVFRLIQENRACVMPTGEVLSQRMIINPESPRSIEHKDYWGDYALEMFKDYYYSGGYLPDMTAGEYKPNKLSERQYWDHCVGVDLDDNPVWESDIY